MNATEAIEILTRRNYVRLTGKLQAAVGELAEQVRKSMEVHDLDLLDVPNVAALLLVTGSVPTMDALGNRIRNR